jgi:hypothetical protein
MSHRLQVTLDDELFQALQSEADRTGASLAEVVRRSVAERLGILSMADRLAVLDRTAGMWADRDQTGVEYQAELRSGLSDRPVATVAARKGGRSGRGTSRTSRTS